MCAKTIKNQQPTKRQIPRREFLNITGLGILGASILPAKVFSGFKNISSNEPAKIGLQLYTVRNEIKNNIADTLHRIADIGFEAVETALLARKYFNKRSGKIFEGCRISCIVSTC